MAGMSTFEGFIQNNTGKAISFQSHYWEGPLWLPMSQIEVEPDGDMSVIVKVKDWLTRKRGIEEFKYYSAEDIQRIAEL